MGRKNSNTYASLFLTISDKTLGIENLEHAKDQVFRRMAFNVYAKNCDDHSKNFSFLLRKNGNWELAPAYDVTFAHNPKGEWTSRHLMGVNGKFSSITNDDLIQIGERFGTSNPHAVLAEVAESVKKWISYADEAHLREDIAQEIQSFHFKG